MPKTLADTLTILNPSLLAMTPRQVLLANPKMTSAKPSALNKGDKALVLLSIARYLQKNGFSKTLKKFKSEAQLEEDGWKDLKLDLEEICLKFLDKGSDAATCSSGLDQDVKKKKSKKKNCENMVTEESRAAEKSANENRNVKEKKDKKNSIALTKESQELRSEVSKEPGNDAARELQHNEADKKQKDKKKKDCRSVPECVTKEENPQIETMPKQATWGKSEDLKSSKGKNDTSSEVEKKSKDKKKRKSKSASNEVANDVEVKQDSEKLKSLMMDIRKAGSEEETINSEINKEIIPQKRKRLDSEENDSQPVDKEPLKQSKRRKKENKGTIASEQNSEAKASQNGEVDLLESQKTPSKHQDGKENGSMDKAAEKSETGKDTKKKGNGSAEPQSTAAKAFQRVKVDEVVFADERLQDNSYWAKDGAEIGYGAKAQEVLGQVRGKDFRHEKTKKKRGSYRGGQIDLQSRSVKFNYSDDE